MALKFIALLLSCQLIRARGLALGVSSHGIGTARAFQVSDQAGAFAALTMGLMALASALVLPFVLRWVFSG